MIPQVKTGGEIFDPINRSHSVRVLASRGVIQTNNEDEIAINKIIPHLDEILKRLELVETAGPSAGPCCHFVLPKEYDIVFYPPVVKPAYIKVGCLVLTADQVREVARQLRELPPPATSGCAPIV
jgi:hypothetical protein